MPDYVAARSNVFKPPPRSGPLPTPSTTPSSPVLIPSSIPTSQTDPPPAKQHENDAKGATRAPSLGKKHYVLAGQIGSPGASEQASDEGNASDVEYRSQGLRQTSTRPPPATGGRSA